MFHLIPNQLSGIYKQKDCGKKIKMQMELAKNTV